MCKLVGIQRPLVECIHTHNFPKYMSTLGILSLHIYDRSTKTSFETYFCNRAKMDECNKFSSWCKATSFCFFVSIILLQIDSSLWIMHHAFIGGNDLLSRRRPLTCHWMSTYCPRLTSFSFFHYISRTLSTVLLHAKGEVAWTVRLTLRVHRTILKYGVASSLLKLR